MQVLNLLQNYDDIVNAIIQPPKQEYSTRDLGKAYRRSDLRLRSRRGYTIECSYFEPCDFQGQIPCVVYLHAQGCSRLEGLKYLDTICSNGMSLFIFDFCASGKSGGKYCSLGWYEQDDLECVVQYLRNTGKVNRIALWGRSMGAITALLYTKRDPNIACMILDSAFTSFKQFTRDFIKQKASFSSIISSATLPLIRKSVKARALFDIDQIDPLSQAPAIKCPALYAAGEDDALIPTAHSQELYNQHTGPKKLVFFAGDHNSERPLTFRLDAIEFLNEHLLSKKEPLPLLKSVNKSSSTGREFINSCTERCPTHYTSRVESERKDHLQENLAKQRVFKSVERNLGKVLSSKKDYKGPISPFEVTQNLQQSRTITESERDSSLNQSNLHERKNSAKLAFTWLVEDSQFIRSLSHSKSSDAVSTIAAKVQEISESQSKQGLVIDFESMQTENPVNNPNCPLIQKMKTPSSLRPDISLTIDVGNKHSDQEGNNSNGSESPMLINSQKESFYLRNEVRGKITNNSREMKRQARGFQPGSSQVHSKNQSYISFENDLSNVSRASQNDFSEVSRSQIKPNESENKKIPVVKLELGDQRKSPVQAQSNIIAKKLSFMKQESVLESLNSLEQQGLGLKQSIPSLSQANKSTIHSLKSLKDSFKLPSSQNQTPSNPDSATSLDKTEKLPLKQLNLNKGNYFLSDKLIKLTTSSKESQKLNTSLSSVLTTKPQQYQRKKQFININLSMAETPTPSNIFKKELSSLSILKSHGDEDCFSESMDHSPYSPVYTYEKSIQGSRRH